MKQKTTLLLLIAMWFVYIPSYGACNFVPTNVQIATTSLPRNGIIISWDPDIANLGATKYSIVTKFKTTNPYTIDTIQSGVQPSAFIPFRDLCNGEYIFTVFAVCPDGTYGAESDSVVLTITSEEACFLSTTLCPGIEIDANDIDIYDGSKKITIPCYNTSYTLKPKLNVVGGTIVDYKVESIPYSPPYPLTEGEDIPLSKDDYYSSVTYLPFKFCFYENTYEELLMSPNGMLSFNTQNANNKCGWSMNSYSTNLPISNFGGDFDWRNGIYGVFEDLNPNTAVNTGTGSFKWGIRGEAPCRVFINSYFDIPLFSHSTLRQSYQIVLYEGTNIIDVYVLKRYLPPSWNLGRGIIGVQNASGTKATVAPGRNILDSWSTIVNGKNKPEAWRFTPIVVNTDSAYKVTWTNIKGDTLALGDSLTVYCETFVRDKIISTLELLNSCSGETATYRDTVVLGFEKEELIINDTICQTEPYKKNGWNLPNQNIAGEYEFFRNVTGDTTTFCGCDTIHTLKLKVNKRPNTDSTIIACKNDTVWLNNKFMVDKVGYLLDTLVSSSGCDSIIVLRVNRYPNPAAGLENIPEICADDGSFILDFFQEPQDKVPSGYSIDFDLKAENAGFVDQTGNFDSTTYKITVDMPDTLYPDTYCAEISFNDTVYDCTATSFQICFDVFYPDTILNQKWDDLIAVKNKHYNGGFEISAIQWYQDINGQSTPIVGETGGFLKKDVTKGVSYRVEITRPNGSKMMSCPITIGNGKPQKPLIIISDKILIKIGKGKSRVNLWTVTGVLMATYSQTQPEYEIDTPADGTYLLEVITEHGGKEVKPLIINRR